MKKKPITLSLNKTHDIFYLPTDNTILSALLMEKYVTRGGIESSKEGGNTIIDIELSREEKSDLLFDLISAVSFVNNIDDSNAGELIT